MLVLVIKLIDVKTMLEWLIGRLKDTLKQKNIIKS